MTVKIQDQGRVRTYSAYSAYRSWRVEKIEQKRPFAAKCIENDIIISESIDSIIDSIIKILLLGITPLYIIYLIFQIIKLLH